MSENRVLRRIFGPKKEEVVGGWRRLHNEELIRLITSRKMRWAGHVARMEEMKSACNMLFGKPEGRDHYEDVGVD
jgi:hypothetical protein